GNLSDKTVSSDFTFWIPTFVGMTGCRFVGMTWCRFPCGWIRHSRAGGNLDLRTTAIFKDYLKVRDSDSRVRGNDEKWRE
ncbi:hypothetical protein CIJ82_06940, partial [Neisseria meningitidis]